MTSPLNKILFTIFLLLHFFANAQVLDKDGIPEKPSPPRLINDFAEIVSETNRQNLEDKLIAFNDSTSTQICIVTVKNVGDYSIEDYAVRLGRKWGVGQKDKNNGILITVSKEDRKVDIEIGYGLESYVTDYDTKHIIDELIVPAFKQSNYYEGLDDASNRLIAQLQGTYKTDSYGSNSNSSGNSGNNLPVGLFIILGIFVLIIIISAFSKPGSGGGSGGSGWTWGSGGGSSWSSGGGNSGGFSGFGGGSFGGGGSSGSW